MRAVFLRRIERLKSIAECSVDIKGHVFARCLMSRGG